MATEIDLKVRNLSFTSQHFPGVLMGQEKRDIPGTRNISYGWLQKQT